MSEPSSNPSRAFQTSARSRRRVVKPKKWLTVLLLILLLAIGTALFFVLRYALKNGFGRADQPAQTDAVTVSWKKEAPSEQAGRVLAAQLKEKGLILPDLSAA